ncbi:flavin reductase (DIM6/NTAB) family NADH-FMN oxidoreductase RutF [Arthrobacter stackebrandtii]|uniref:Flavin reductase (DIM6/NTAB) family NADH-FMN oxidoreductase RutF n=1 Tax=Arthrobacter stackebrandtii TaxID=272161 RepID=A0ABS4YW24_9MICC|nr:flavin reductase family protein [Arthrobacter stackebrandtii]MBP2412685.1 flavin reductase (DIM6/NTAB) family NADH-FMN oxidoreductase RutF [Arthrobacter stackebrandtii]PYG98888.1 oxidoreductase [Arthrobacter stackebrandtii]
MELADSLDVHRVFPQDPSQDQIDEYRRLSAEQAGSVAVISTKQRGRDHAATVSAFISVSYDPPTLLVSLYAESRIALAVAESGNWALSLLSAEQKRQANWLASPGTPVEGLLNQIDFRRGPATGNAVIAGALAYFEVETTQVHTAATHLLVVGQVVSMGEDALWTRELSPLIHYGGDYRRLKP